MPFQANSLIWRVENDIIPITFRDKRIFIPIICCVNTTNITKQG